MAWSYSKKVKAIHRAQRKKPNDFGRINGNMKSDMHSKKALKMNGFRKLTSGMVEKLTRQVRRMAQKV